LPAAVTADGNSVQARREGDIYELKTPDWNAAWWVTSYATDRQTDIQACATFDATIHSEKLTSLTILLFDKLLLTVLTCQ
jgi:hypothetical protein